jgi:hypothetical protein
MTESSPREQRSMASRKGRAAVLEHDNIRDAAFASCRDSDSVISNGVAHPVSWAALWPGSDHQGASDDRANQEHQ